MSPEVAPVASSRAATFIANVARKLELAAIVVKEASSPAPACS